MRQTEKAARELRFRVKGTVGLVVLGVFLGAIAWVWRATGGEADLHGLVRVFAAATASPYFWAVVGLSGALGGWLAYVIFWRVRDVSGGENRGPDGMTGPSF